jgi:hypothetical protein
MFEHTASWSLVKLVVMHRADCPYPDGRRPCRCRPEDLVVKPMAEYRREQAERN